MDFMNIIALRCFLTITDSSISVVDSFRFLGTTITRDLKWKVTISPAEEVLPGVAEESQAANPDIGEVLHRHD